MKMLIKSSLTLILLINIIWLPKVWSEETISVSYCVDPHWAPYESIENNQHLGISKQYLQLFEKLTPLRFNFVATKDWNQTLEFVKTGKCQILPLLNRSEEREQYLTFSNTYFRAPNALYGHYDQLMVGNLSSITTQKIAVVNGYRLHQYLLKTFPKMNIITVNTEREGLLKVANQEIDYFVGSFYSANRLIEELSLAQLRIVGIAELEDNLRVGVNKNSEFLIPYFNNAIAKMTEQDHNRIFSALKVNLVKQADYSIIITAISIFSIITVILSIAYLNSVKHAKQLQEKNLALKHLHEQLDQKNQQLAEQAIRDPLTQLYNRSHLAELIDQQIKLKGRYNTKACLLMIDIDDFKLINDSLGHKVGDDILKKFAVLLNECARDSDVVARWGGEEFVLLCPETQTDDATLLAKRFQQALAKLKTDSLPSITCSIGIAELNTKDTADEWFISADNAMYHAKNKGKNTIHTVVT